MCISWPNQMDYNATDTLQKRPLPCGRCLNIHIKGLMGGRQLKKIREKKRIKVYYFDREKRMQ